MKLSRFLVAIAVLTQLMHAVDEQSVTLKSSSIESHAVRVIADFQGKRTELDCNIGLSSCSQPQPGEYSMRPAAAAERVYNDCTNVVLLKSSGAAKEKIGVYCWANEGDCFIVSCVKVQVETIPVVVSDTALKSAPKPPKATHTVDPRYSANALRGVKDEVILVAVTVPPDGIPKDVKIAKGVRPDLDKQAVDAVQQWRFEPATRDGKPVEAAITVEVRLRRLR